MMRFRATRERFLSLLGAIPGLRVIPSQANYFLCELLNGQTAKRLASTLLETSHCFIKDLRKKIPEGQYIRIAIRDDHDNAVLANCLSAAMAANEASR